MQLNFCRLLCRYLVNHFNDKWHNGEFYQQLLCHHNLFCHLFELSGLFERSDGGRSEFISNKLSCNGNGIYNDLWSNWQCGWQQCHWISAGKSLHINLLFVRWNSNQ